MIIIKQNEDKMMNVLIKGNAEDIANEYAALTYWLMIKHPIIFDRASDYLEKAIKEL